MLVFAAPMRYWTMTGMLKNIIERFYRVPDGGDIIDLPHDHYETYRAIETALLVSSADTGWYTYNWLREWYPTLCNFMGWNDCGNPLVGGCDEYSWEANEEMHRRHEPTALSWTTVGPTRTTSSRSYAGGWGSCYSTPRRGSRSCQHLRARAQSRLRSVVRPLPE